LPPDLTIALRLDEASDGGEIQSYLKERTGQSTVPNIFINKKHVGGNYRVLTSHPIFPIDDFPQAATVLRNSRAKTSSLLSLPPLPKVWIATPGRTIHPEYTNNYVHDVYHACNHSFFIRDFSF